MISRVFAVAVVSLSATRYKFNSFTVNKLFNPCHGQRLFGPGLTVLLAALVRRRIISGGLWRIFDALSVCFVRMESQ